MEGNTKDKSTIGLILRGMAMGIAEVIPGVSGGTIAFISGIYQQLISSISKFTHIFQYFKEGGIRLVWQQLHLDFLFRLLSGMLIGILAGIFLISYLLEHAAAPLWAFFFGLISASVIYMLRKVELNKINTWLLFVLSTIVAFGLTSISFLNGSTNLIYVFFSGAIAISAMILPGISGSFILLILGMYTVIIPNLKRLLTDFSLDGLLMISVFACGCLLGLLSFSKLLKYTFEHYEKPTITMLSGLMLGSLHRIWPWRNPTSILNKENAQLIETEAYLADPMNENFKILSEQNVWYDNYLADPMIALSIFSFVLGFLLIMILIIYEFRQKI